MLPPPLLAAVDRLVAGPGRAVVLIDGGAGAGKTTLAQALVAGWPDESAQLVSLDDLYPGWHGLAAGAAAVPELIVGSGYRSWDWRADRPGPWRSLDPARALVVEGCGAITAGARALAGLAVWVDLEPDERRRRALARDGGDFCEHWSEWADQEARHWERDSPRQLADLVIEPVSQP